MATPRFEYSLSILSDRAKTLVELSAPFGYVPRFAVKANPHPRIVALFSEAGLCFDASSSYEATELLKRGIEGRKISLSSQQPAHNLEYLLSEGVTYVATSLHQLNLFCASSRRPKTVGLRVNPGSGSGHNNRTTTGGINSSFGLWHDYADTALSVARDYNVSIDRLHVHGGSGADPSIWANVIDDALSLVEHFPDVISLDIGGGYKVHRYGDEKETDMDAVIRIFSDKLIEFEKRTSRKIQLEVEPGTWLVASAGTLFSEVVDIVDTGKDGHTFIRLDTGMNDIIRPSMYGAQHRIEVLNANEDTADYVVVGHNCETGDILSPAVSNPEMITARKLKKASIGDIVAIHDAGAYCASFSVHGYNSFPDAEEIFI